MAKLAGWRCSCFCRRISGRGFGLSDESVSKHHQLFRVFAGGLTALIREMNDITVLPVSEVEDLDVPRRGQVSLDPVHPGLKRLLSVHKAGVDRELASFEPLVEQEVAEIRGGLPERPRRAGPSARR